MLSLMSSASDRLTGTPSLLNCVIGCGTPSSSIVKSFCSSAVTSRPSASRTVTAVVTSSEAERKFFERASTICSGIRLKPDTTATGAARSAISARSLLRKVIERAACTHKQLSVGRHRRGEYFIIERVDLQDLPFALRADH